MKVLFDHQVFTLQNYGGISRYFCELMDQFSHSADIEFILSLRYSKNENLLKRDKLDNYWSNQSDFLCESRLIPFIQRKLNIDVLNLARLNQFESVTLLKKDNYDVFHPTYYNPYFLKYIEKKPYVLTVYDMIHELYPESFSEKDPVRKWKKKLIENADSIISISENTKKDILNLYDISESKISVVYLGNPLENITEFKRNDLESNYRIFEENYLLYVGKRSGCKNFQFFIRSIADYLNATHLHVVCAGGGLFTPNELSLFKEFNIIDKIHYSEVNDYNLKNLYENARAFIFPSLHEGFGLPVLEAFSCKCPIILSNSSSLPEIGGNAACYIDPNSSESILQGVKSVLSDESYRLALISKGIEQLKYFSWEKTANDTKKVYESLL